MRMKRLPILAGPLLLGFALPLAACGTKAITPLPETQILTGHKLNQGDANAVTAAYQIGQLDSQQGHLAAVQAFDPRVRAISGELVAKVNLLAPRLESVIAADGIAPPKRLPAALQRRVDALEVLQGVAFDRAYLTDQIESHQHAIAVFQDAQRRTQDPAMRSLVDDTLPILQDDLAKLQMIAATAR